MKSQDDSRIAVVDPHIHLWDVQRLRYPWLELRRVAFSGDNRLLPDSYTVKAFLAAARDIDVLKSVHVEANPADPLAEVQWLQSLADDPQNHGHPHGIVGSIDLSRADAAAKLDEFVSYRNMRGVRQILNVHEDARYRYVDRHFLEDPIWRSNLQRLMRHDWSFDLQIYPSQIAAALAVIDEAADLRFVLNHAGMFVDRDRPGAWREWREGLRALAARDNVVVKISGLVMFDHHWTLESLRPYVLDVIDAFGVERCMFASNFPIDGIHAEYEELWQAYARLLAGASASERDQLLRSNAMRYYALS